MLAEQDTKKDKLEEFCQLSILYDFYGELLGEHKRQIFENYVQNDLSLAEIADEAGISRQGVHDIIRRCTKALKEYESKLKLAEKFELAKKHIADIKDIAEKVLESGDASQVREIAEISEQMLREL